MKKEKRALLILFCSVAIGIVSCQKNDTTTPTGNDRDKFLGTWHVISNHKSPLVAPTQSWELTIVGGNSSNEILLDNFNQIGTTKSLTGIVNGSQVNIPTQ